MSEGTEDIRCGIVVHDRGDRAEELLAAFVEAVRKRPVRVGGLYQVTEIRPHGSNLMEVVDVATGTRVRISQDLGAGSNACCLDPSGLVEAAALLRRSLEDGVDLLIANKFAGMEADGKGLAPDVFEAMAEGVPVVMLVSRRYLDKWEALSGGVGQRLAPRMEDLWAWYEALGLEEKTVEAR